MRFPNDIKVCGDMNYRGSCPPESAEQMTFFNELAKRYPDAASIAVHPRNEGKRTRRQAEMHKAEGMNPGASDIIIPGSPSLVIELKRLDHTQSKWQKGQQEYLRQCARNGSLAFVALGHEAALDCVKLWLNS